MKNLKFISLLVLILTSINHYSQQKPPVPKIKISGIVIEKVSKQHLEYATITFTNGTSTKSIAGGITNPKGEFNIDIVPGTYDIKIEFISFKPIILKDRKLLEKTNLGLIALEEDATQLNEVQVRAEKTTVDIKLDKKVYSVGNDLMVKGGTVSDVLNNIPSVSVDAEGAISLRGNENVTIFIDGKPSNAININEALRLISADAIDKVEVITNPSARYDAEGGAGILNIVLKKGKNQGFNGTFIGGLGTPKNNSLSGTLNYKTEKYNLFTNQGYADRLALGNALYETNYLNPKPNSPSYIKEIRDIEDNSKSYNGNLGIELFLNNSTTWTNTLNYRNSNEENLDDVNYDNQYADPSKNDTRTRVSNEENKENDVEFKSNLQKKFKKDGHKLDVDVQISNNNEKEIADIVDSENGNDFTENKQKNTRQLYQLDYVLPFGKGSQFEAGYRGSFVDQLTDVSVFNNGVINTDFTNNLEYIENVNAFYTQYGLKVNKFSYLFGLRWEDTKVNVNQLSNNDFNTKKYNNFFPSAFVTYEISEESSLSLSYSRRITRPRGRLINPFSNYSSNINIFQGNPDLDPAMSDAIDFGFLKKWGKFLLSTSLYNNRTTDAFLFVRINSGSEVNGVPVIISTPINLATENRLGFEFNLNYSPYKWWKLNSNFNFFNVDTQGDYTYTDFNNVEITQNFDQKTTSWSARLNSKVTLPAKIDWQTNMNYFGDQKTAQGKFIGIFAMNLGFSKDVLKDKATLAFNVSDVFNTRKMKMETLIPGVIESYSERQRNVRQFTLSFTYRLNKSKNEKEKQPRREMEEGGGDMPG
ncbi:outer membrane beta-barrel family protein [Flavobacterium nackdongense]|uniref:TonB-dependent receptor n=1 Tax=Flavobacterium nackdongense TaxID=2547394 RepID=A0A4P6YCW9_9FLAO|nr:outer membrane beta-barrel family protein [Flavobacterium nackdongense]QBN18183.1 TonB-dependent receptor [Flavobacterium nackdongense]